MTIQRDPRDTMERIEWSPRDLRTLPKAHLHIHLEGAMRPSTLAELADHHGVAVPRTRGYGDFPAFSRMYRAACAVLQTADDLERVVTEVVEDAAAAGAHWVEPAVYPVPHRDACGSDIDTIEVVIGAAERAAAHFGIGAGIMITADRTVDPAEALELAGIAARFAGCGAVAFGLANHEDGHPPEPFAEAFAIARDAGLLSTPHAGELAGPTSIIGALDALGADRIEHGVRAVEDPDLVRRLADEAVCLDVCPTSNVLLGVVEGIDQHPLRLLLDAGVACSINADDPLLFGPGLLEEYELCRHELGLTDEQLADIAHNSLLASAAPVALRNDALAAIDAWLAT